MTNRQLRRFEMLFRINEFGAARRDRFPETSRAGRAFAAVADAVLQLKERAMAQLALRQEGVRARRAARAALLEMLEAISRTARVIQADDPAFPNTFHLPPRRSAQAVLTAARLAAQHIDPVATHFIEHGMPETFVADFKARLDTYEQAIRRREVGKGENAAARASIDATLDSAMAAARRLDVIVGNRLRQDAAALAEWARNRRVPYSRRLKATPPDAAAEQPAASEPGELVQPPSPAAADAPPESKPAEVSGERGAELVPVEVSVFARKVS